MTMVEEGGEPESTELGGSEEKEESVGGRCVPCSRQLH